jgi:hypothetical protein
LKSNPGHTNRPFNNFHSPQYALPLDKRDFYAACIEQLLAFSVDKVTKEELLAGGGVGGQKVLKIFI